MKRIFLALLFGYSVLTATAQDVKEPEFPDVFYALRDGQLLKLERQDVSTRVTGFLSATKSIELAGAESPVRFKAGVLQLIVRSLDSLKTDPASIYHIRRLESKKEIRAVVLGTASVSGAKASTKSLISFEVSKYGTSSVKLAVGDIPPGEYAVGKTNGSAVFCFGVD